MTRFSAFFSEFYQSITLVLRDKLKECTFDVILTVHRR